MPEGGRSAASAAPEGGSSAALAALEGGRDARPAGMEGLVPEGRDGWRPACEEWERG